MVEVRCEYINVPYKSGQDYFIFTNILVQGHADTINLNHTTGIKVCAGISACCGGIKNLINEGQYTIEIRKGYFNVFTERRYQLRETLDRDSVYALNTLVCQLFEIYNNYPSVFKSFELVDVKEKIENDERTNEHKPRKKREKRMGFHSFIEETYSQKN